MHGLKPSDGGTAVDVAGVEGYAVVAESLQVVFNKVQESMNASIPEASVWWIELTVLANPDDDYPRRPYWVRSDKIVGLTYLSPEHVEQIENEIS